MRGASARAASGSPIDDLAALFGLLLSRRHELAEPTPELAVALQQKLDSVQAESLGVSPEDMLRLPRWCTSGYQEVYSSSDMTLCVFFLRAGASLPLHDHPGMHVFGRLLFGRMRVINFDPMPEAPPPRRAPRGSFLATLRCDEVMGPRPMTYGLGPGEGNYHELHALEDTAFFDVLAPPYDPWAGRDCTYFHRAPVEDQGDDEGQHWVLMPVGQPELRMGALDYRGPSMAALADRKSVV